MRMTVNLESDVAAAVEGLQRTAGLGKSEALNLLARRGLSLHEVAEVTARFVQRTHSSTFRIAIDNTAEVLQLLDAEP